MIEISIHALLAESDWIPLDDGSLFEVFLSTLSLRRATDILAHLAQHLIFLSTLSLRRATLLLVGLTLTSPDFYPRSPCGERRAVPWVLSPKATFLSTLSLRRATYCSRKCEV